MSASSASGSPWTSKVWRGGESKHSAPVVERIREWALTRRSAPRSAFRKALEYMLKLWDGLTVFLSNPMVPIDNNHAERQRRDMVLGRKNHYGSKSKRGTEVATLFYSLIETPDAVTLPESQD